jgi:hypothetical protein
MSANRENTMAAISAKSTEKKDAKKGLSPAADFPAASNGISPQPDLNPVPHLVGDALAEDAQRLGRQDDLRPQSGIDADLRRGLLGDVPIDPELGHPVAVVADVDQDTEGDEHKTEDEADKEAGREEVGQEVFSSNVKDHVRGSSNRRSKNIDSRTARPVAGNYNKFAVGTEDVLSCRRQNRERVMKEKGSRGREARGCPMFEIYGQRTN